jgi:hypothetical protein
MKIDMRGIAALAVMALLAGCGGGSGSGSAAPTAGKNGARALASTESPGVNCPAGGARLDSGIDLNANGILDASEIVSTQYVCNGSPGAAGAAGSPGLAGLAGAPGAAGTSGLMALVQMSPEPAGAHCAISGTKVSAGADANTNGTLDGAEATSIAYVCDGATGAMGVAGTNGSTGTTGSTGAAGADGHDVLMTIAAAGTSITCPAGGSRIQSGIDADRNGTLDIAEVTATSLLCNGSNGAAGSDGNGSLIAVVAEPAGVAHCAAGGSRITSGPDGNHNGILDAGEVLSTAYICNGVAGTNGTPGTNGTNGAAGTNGTNGVAGTNGTNGFTTLTVSTPEGAGINCAAGGVMITSGIDTSRDGVLDDPAEVTARSYNCNGAPGAGVTWIDVSGTSQQAVSGIGYLADNAAQVTITLPTAPTIGDLIEVSGVGAGGWKIAQNGAQSIITRGLSANYTNYGATWTAQTAANSRNWVSIASSADGGKLAAVDYSGYIYTSADSGVSWTARNSPRAWRSIASSADGNKLVAGAEGGQIHTSTDSGVSWTARDSTRNWVAVASSADGSKLLAAVYGSGQVYTSTDSGASWTARDSNRDWSAVASSADGSKLVATVANGQIYTSTDSGVSWTARESGRHWDSVASSADGSKLVATAFYSNIYTSTDSGVSWTARASFAVWSSVASSSDGSRLVAVDNQPGYIYTSTDSGVTWTPRESARSWVAVAASSDCSKLAAVVANGPIYTSASPTDRTTPGSGSLTGSQYDAIKLQYLGNGLFLPLSASSYSGTFAVY